MKESDDYLWDRSGTPDPEVERLEKLLAPLAFDAPLDELRLRRKRSRAPWIGLAGVIVAVAALIALWVWPTRRGDSPCGGGVAGFAFSTIGDGQVACQEHAAARGVLPVGGTLDTGTAEAELTIADIGSARLGPQTRVRLDVVSAKRHQLYLERGRLHALITTSVPELFAVDSAGANVVDLGCEYDLEVDERGAGIVRVKTGIVRLETEPHGIPVVTPAGAHTRLLPGRRSGIAIGNRATGEFAAAIHAYEDRGSPALARVLELATSASDALSVATIGWTRSGDDQRRALDRLAVISPAPQQLTVDEALADRVLLEMWYDEVRDRFREYSRTASP